MTDPPTSIGSKKEELAARWQHLDTETKEILDRYYRLFTKKEMAAFLRISPTSLNRLIAGDNIPFIRVKCRFERRHKIYFDPEEIAKWIVSRTKQRPTTKM